MTHNGDYIIYVSYVYDRLGPYVPGEEDGVAWEENGVRFLNVLKFEPRAQRRRPGISVSGLPINVAVT